MEVDEKWSQVAVQAREQMKQYRTICSRCVLDTTVPDIVFDSEGVCQYCHFYDKQLAEIKSACTPEALESLIRDMKGQGNRYDCVLGLSGGRDSSYLAYLAVKRFGLKVFTTHLDNGADDPIAAQNVQNLVRELRLDFEPISLDYRAFRRIQLAYYKAGVMGLEIPVDHAIVVSYRQVAARHGLKYSLSGHNWATESHLPECWTYDAYDLDNLTDIALKNGATVEDLANLPKMSRWKVAYYTAQLGIKEVRLLNYLDYNQAEAEEVLKREVGWQSYGLKHWESIATRFYQTYVLPIRWGIDKRRSHFSALIASGQMTREEALRRLHEPPCPAEQIIKDKSFMLRWLGIDNTQLEHFMTRPRARHEDYRMDRKGATMKGWARRYLRPIWRRLR